MLPLKFFSPAEPHTIPSNGEATGGLLGSQFLHGTEKTDDLLTAQHPGHMAVCDHRKLVDSVAVHQLERNP